jgi:hypothetical protein
MNSRAPRIASEILRGVVGAHPCGSAIVGDLEEEFARREDTTSVAAARRWYWREVTRTIVAIVPALRLDASIAGRALGVVIVAYTLAIQLSNGASFILDYRMAGIIGPMMVFGALAGAASTRAVVGARALGALMLLLLAIVVGAAHVATSSPTEILFRAAKVACFVLGIGGGAACALACERPASTSR